MIEYDEDELKAWSETIWAGVEYRGSSGGLKAMREFIKWTTEEVGRDE